MSGLQRGDRCQHSETGESGRYVGTTSTGVEIVACDWQDFNQVCETFDYLEWQRANARLAIALGGWR